MLLSMERIIPVAECNCRIPMLEGAGQHAIGCSIFDDDRSHCCGANVESQIDHGEGTVLNICARCGYQCRIAPDSGLNPDGQHGKG